MKADSANTRFLEPDIASAYTRVSMHASSEKPPSQSAFAVKVRTFIYGGARQVGHEGFLSSLRRITCRFGHRQVYFLRILTPRGNSPARETLKSAFPSESISERSQNRLLPLVIRKRFSHASPYILPVLRNSDVLFRLRRSAISSFRSESFLLIVIKDKTGFWYLCKYTCFFRHVSPASETFFHFPVAFLSKL